MVPIAPQLVVDESETDLPGARGLLDETDEKVGTVSEGVAATVSLSIGTEPVFFTVMVSLHPESYDLRLTSRVKSRTTICVCDWPIMKSHATTASAIAATARITTVKASIAPARLLMARLTHRTV